MKKNTVLYSLSLVLSIISCTDLNNPVGLSSDTHSIETKSASPEYYFWYHGKTIDLSFNREYVNIMVDTVMVKKLESFTICAELGLEGLSELDKSGLLKAKITQSCQHYSDYQNVVDELLKDTRIKYVFPYVEQGKGVEPVGTSQYFYVQLREIVPDGVIKEMIPYLEKEFDADALAEESERLGVHIVKQVPYMPDWFILSIEGSSFRTSIEAANQFYETGRFEDVDPAFMFTIYPDTVNDTYYSQQWGLKNTVNPGYDINVEEAWAISTMGADIKVAVVDQRVDSEHTDLINRVSPYEYDGPNGMAIYNINQTGENHGTHVAGIIAAEGNNAAYIAGVAYNSMILRVYEDTSSSTFAAESASGISWAWQFGADVINCSWHLNTNYSAIIESSIISALTNGRYGLGTVVVFSAGNAGTTTLGYPARFDDRILTVGSIGSTGVRSYFSNYGSKLDVVAPGENILSLLPSDSQGYLSGTSMAAPHVSGVAALMLSVNSALSRDEIIRIIQQTSRKISPGGIYSYSPRNTNFSDETWSQDVGCGLVDAGMAVKVASALSTPPSTTFDPGISITSPISLSIDQHEGTIQGNFSLEMVYASLLPAYVNSSYTYYWYVSAPAHPYWAPALSYISGSDAVISVPNPGSYSTMYIRCLVFNGSTLVATPSYTLHVDP